MTDRRGGGRRGGDRRGGGRGPAKVCTHAPHSARPGPTLPARDGKCRRRARFARSTIENSPGTRFTRARNRGANGWAIRAFASSPRGSSATRAGAPPGATRRPRPDYDVVIIGGGGHGLSTAYYLAKNHGITNVAVLEKGYLGGGNVGRNTTIVRANYFLPGNSEFYSPFAEALGGAGAGAELQRDAFAARADQPLPFRRPARRLRPARQRDGQPGRRRGAARPRRGAPPSALSRFRQSPASRSTAGSITRAAAPRATTRWPGAMPAAPTGAAST